MYSTPGEIEMAPRRCAPWPGQAREVRQPGEREVHLARRAAELVPPHVRRGTRRAAPRVHQLQERAVRVEARDDEAARRSPRRSSSTTPVARPSSTLIRSMGASVRISTPASRGRARDRLADGARAAAREAPGAERAVDLAHVVVQQHVGGARRAHAQERADDAADADIVAFSTSVSNQWSSRSAALMVMSWIEVVLVAPRQLLEAPQQAVHPVVAGQVGATGVGRHHREDRLDEARHVDHRLAVLVVRLGVDAPSGGRSRAACARGRSSARGSSPLGIGVNVPSSGRISRPWRGRSSSRMISGRSSETT